MTDLEQKRAQALLRDIARDVRNHYYDPKFHGLDWDAKVRETQQRIDHASSGNKALSEIAALLDSLDDSHTVLIPPPPGVLHEYGWEALLIGEHCYVTRVRPGSDAEAKGLKAGDEILGINGYAPTRKTFEKITYFFDWLHPQPSLRLALRDSAGRERTLNIAAEIVERRRALEDYFSASGEIRAKVRNMDLANVRPREVEMGDRLLIVKFAHFNFNEWKIDSLISSARKHEALILDMRGNGGGSEDTLKYLLGGVFEKEVRIGDLARRYGHESFVAKSHGHCFTGRLIVLVNSRSASAAELFARVVQLEKRGTILGDISAGRVMRGRFYDYDGIGASITDADLIMTDGKSLERVGVTPDELILPTTSDLEFGRDPVLAHAAETLGVKLTPEDAGKLFPYEWPLY